MTEREFAKQNFIERGLISCDQVSSYDCIADVLAIDLNKKRIIEYEFKNNSHDLKVAEKKKSKYRMRNLGGFWHNKKTNRHERVKHLVDFPKPHQFFFVVPKELYEKEKKYLHSLNSFTGVMTQFPGNPKVYVMKRSAIRKSNLQKFDVVLKHITKRLASIYTWG